MKQSTDLGGYLLPITPDQLRTTVREAVGEALGDRLPREEPESGTNDGGILLSVKETAELLHVSRVTLREMEKRGELLPVRIGRRVLYRRSDIDAALSRGGDV